MFLDGSGTEAEAAASEGLWGDLNAEDLETPFILCSSQLLALTSSE